MTTRIVFLCHAATAATRVAAFAGDEPPEPKALQRFLKKPCRLPAYDRAWTSPARRAIETAETLHIEACPDPVLRDCDYGSWTGETLEAVQASDPEGFARWLEDPDAAPHGGEAFSAVARRVGLWMTAFTHAPERILAVTHPAVIKAAVIEAIGAPPRSFWRIDVAPLSLTRLTARQGRWTLAGLNETLSRFKSEDLSAPPM